jgi:signal peptide peptidase SppA
MKLLFWRARRIPVIQLHGVLASRGPLNIEAVGPLIERAFNAAGKCGTVLLDIESPGGSPVQSALIARRIRRHADENGAKVRAVIAEVGASGGYWLACAADEIVAHPMSIVGSIGVIGGGFGLNDAIARLGIERRLYTAGENKARLDPFSPERPEDVAFTRQLLDNLHDQFKSWVRERRTGRLKADEAKIFDGGYMLGDQALAVGLVDRLGDLEAELRDIGGKKARSDVIKPKKRGLLSRIPGLAMHAAFDVIEERSRPQLRS